jgi:hypothetical protein
LFACPTSRSSSRPPRRPALPHAPAPVLWPLLTPAAPTRLRSRACCPQTAGRQVSPGKNADFPCNLAPSTLSALDCIRLRCHWPARPAGPGLPVRSHADRPRMGFVFLKAQVCLRLPSHPTSRRRTCLWLYDLGAGTPGLTVGAINLRDRDFHSQARAHAGRTRKGRAALRLPSRVSASVPGG